MCFSGLDSTGGAGLQADIEAVASMGCHACPVATALTVQDTRKVHRFESVDPVLFEEQARTVLADIRPHVFKLGMLGDVAIVEVVTRILADCNDIPVVLDPVLGGGGGGALGCDEMPAAMREKLLPHVTVLTPNSPEARQLVPEADNLQACGEALMKAGCDFVLITGEHENSEHIENRLFANDKLLETFSWDRLPGSFHGSGCTLSASLAGLMAQGLEPFTAIHEAQEYTWETLQHACQVGKGQALPNRFFWARGEDE